MLAVLGRAYPLRPSRHRNLGVATKGCRQRSEDVAAVAALPENTSTDQGPEQSAERVSVGVHRGRKLVGR